MGPCGALCAQIWPLGGQNRARGTFASLRTDGEISEVPRNTPFFHQLLGRNKHFPEFPSMIRACYGRCESLTTFQCQVVENEAWPQTDGSLKLPPVAVTILTGRSIFWGRYGTEHQCISTQFHRLRGTRKHLNNPRSVTPPAGTCTLVSLLELGAWTTADLASWVLKRCEKKGTQALETLLRVEN